MVVADGDALVVALVVVVVGAFVVVVVGAFVVVVVGALVVGVGVGVGPPPSFGGACSTATVGALMPVKPVMPESFRFF